jgi:transcriptional regulator with XRE-family HTH domain
MAARKLRSGHLAETLGVTPATVSNWRVGRSVPRGDKLLELAAVLGVDAGDLLFGGFRSLRDGGM